MRRVFAGISLGAPIPGAEAHRGGVVPERLLLRGAFLAAHLVPEDGSAAAAPDAAAASGLGVEAHPLVEAEKFLVWRELYPTAASAGLSVESLARRLPDAAGQDSLARNREPALSMVLSGCQRGAGHRPAPELAWPDAPQPAELAADQAQQESQLAVVEARRSASGERPLLRAQAHLELESRQFSAALPEPAARQDAV